jgi:hypothetical protein
MFPIVSGSKSTKKGRLRHVLAISRTSKRTVQRGEHGMNTMKNHSVLFVLLAGLTALALTIFPLAPATMSAAPTPPPQPVFVTNTAAQAIPTAAQGTTAVSGTVNIGTMPAVTLTSGAKVRDADNPARQTPIVGESPMSGAANQSGCTDSGDGSCLTGLFQVPSGKRLVLEYASMAACMPEGQVALMFVRIADSSLCPVGGTTCSGAFRQYYSSLSAPVVEGDVASICPVSGTGMTSIAQPVRIYVDAGDVVAAGGIRNKGGTGTASFIFGLSGYLVDIP